MKIVCANSLYQAREAFSTVGDVLMLSDRAINAADVASADALVVRSKTRVDRSLLDGSSVRFVGTATAGFDHFDMAYLNARGIAAVAAPGCNANSVAEYVATSLLYMADRYNLDLSQKTLGVIGVGAVGSLVAEKGWALGMHVMLNDPPLFDATRDPGYQPLEDLLNYADILTLHVPLTRGGRYPTEHLVDVRFLAGVRPGTILINASRGEVIDTDALLTALERGAIPHAVADVFEDEPDVNPLLVERLDAATPHIAGHSLEGKLAGTEMVYRSLCNFFEVEPVWTPEPLPEPAEPVIALDARGLRDEEALWRLVSKACPLLEDDRHLRDALSGDPAARGRRFDELRSSYPARREFSAYRVRFSHAGDSLARKALALGFRLDEATAP